MSSTTSFFSMKSLYDDGNAACSSSPGSIVAVSVLCALAHGRSQSSARRVHLSAIHSASDVDSVRTAASDGRKCVECAEPCVTRGVRA